MAKRCAECGTPMVTRRAGSVFCEPKCRAKFNRHGGVPKELRKVARWVGWKPVQRNGKTTKLPLSVRGGPAHVDVPETWATFAEARAKFGDRIGFVLDESDDISCVDLDGVLVDGVLTDAARRVIDSLPGLFALEVSPSGEGVHAWHRGEPVAGTNRDEGGLRVERYHKGRYVTVTGRKLFL